MHNIRDHCNCPGHCKILYLLRVIRYLSPCQLWYKMILTRLFQCDQNWYNITGYVVITGYVLTLILVWLFLYFSKEALFACFRKYIGEKSSITQSIY